MITVRNEVENDNYKKLMAFSSFTMSSYFF